MKRGWTLGLLFNEVLKIKSCQVWALVLRTYCSRFDRGQQALLVWNGSDRSSCIYWGLRGVWHVYIESARHVRVALSPWHGEWVSEWVSGKVGSSTDPSPLPLLLNGEGGEGGGIDWMNKWIIIIEWLGCCTESRRAVRGVVAVLALGCGQRRSQWVGRWGHHHVSPALHSAHRAQLTVGCLPCLMMCRTPEGVHTRKLKVRQD